MLQLKYIIMYAQQEIIVLREKKSVNNNMHSEKNVLLWFTNDATKVDTSKHSCKCSKKDIEEQ